MKINQITSQFEKHFWVSMELSYLAVTTLLKVLSVLHYLKKLDKKMFIFARDNTCS